MRVTIVDVEWYRKKSFLPNPKCMKISSYYKQQNAIINFAQNEAELKFEYDKMYVIKENILTPMITTINMLDENVFLIGSGLKYYSRYQEDISDIMAACRPDYLLYPLKQENKMSKSNIVQFFYHGKIMPVIQDYHASYKKTKNTYVIDENFWEHSVEDLEKCYEFLKLDSNIVFKFPINLDSILIEKRKVEIFTSLKIDFEKNDIFCDLNTVEKMDNFILCMEKIKVSKRQRMSIKTNIFYEKDHFQFSSQPIKDLSRYLLFIKRTKELQIKITLQAPPRSKSPFWFHFEDLEAWTNYNPYLSYVEFMSLPNRLTINCLDLKEFFSNSLQWSDDGIDRMRNLWVHYPELMEQVGYVKWGKEKLENLNMRNVFKSNKFRGELKC